MDRFFTSLPLLDTLSSKLIPAPVTIQRNRLKNGQKILTQEKDFKKNPRETSEQIHSEGISVLQWQDNRTFLLASNFIGANPETSCRRYCRKEKKEIQVKQPRSVHLYNKFKGGVVTLDQNINTYVQDSHSHSKMAFVDPWNDPCLLGSWNFVA